MTSESSPAKNINSWWQLPAGLIKSKTFLHNKHLYISFSAAW
jgi:hypothetical protein